ncbi:MAG: c-type cytochrome [Betaproteobacteria bacterium]|nr:c-type cytochrome [Betaproteobacteria bacterium]
MRFCALAFVAALAAPAAAQSGAPVPATNLAANAVRALAANCAACHGTNGVSAGGAIAGLAGMDREYFVGQMRLFKSAKREATVMQQIARGFTDAEFAALGTFFAAQKK